jgi:hypothetical protein
MLLLNATLLFSVIFASFAILSTEQYLPQLQNPSSAFERLTAVRHNAYQDKDVIVACASIKAAWELEPELAFALPLLSDALTVTDAYLSSYNIVERPKTISKLLDLFGKIRLMAEDEKLAELACFDEYTDLRDCIGDIFLKLISFLFQPPRHPIIVMVENPEVFSVEKKVEASEEMASSDNLETLAIASSNPHPSEDLGNHHDEKRKRENTDFFSQVLTTFIKQQCLQVRNLGDMDSLETFVAEVEKLLVINDECFPLDIETMILDVKDKILDDYIADLIPHNVLTNLFMTNLFKTLWGIRSAI